jgi:transaldolase
VGIDKDDLFITLEDEGVAKFEASWSELNDAVSRQLDEATAAG